jgi:IclR family transcriptional regulator, pca regulon regulatory protein
VSGGPVADGAFVQSLERGLLVIRALSAPAPRTLSEVARTAGLSRAAARRFLLTLEQLGYVRHSDGRFALTPRVLELGYAYLSSLTLPELAQPHLEALSARVHESSSMSILDGADVVYVARVAARRIMSVSISVGTRFPAYATSMGRVLLAALPPDERAGRLRPDDLRALTPATRTSPAALERELDRAARRGWALVDQELEAGLRSIAAPVRDAAGRVVAAVNVSTHASRATAARMRAELLPPLLDATDAIGADIAARAPGAAVPA